MLKKNKTVFIFLFVLTRHHQKYEIQVLCHDSAPILAYISIHNLVSAWFLCGQTQITVLSVLFAVGFIWHHCHDNSSTNSNIGKLSSFQYKLLDKSSSKFNVEAVMRVFV